MTKAHLFFAGAAAIGAVAWWLLLRQALPVTVTSFTG